MPTSGAVTTTNLIRTNVWNDTLKERFKDSLVGMDFVTQVDFKDGTTLNIPSVGQLIAEDYSADDAINFQSPDTGNFTFTIDQYKSVAYKILDKDKQDIHYYEELKAKLQAEATRAIEEAVEDKVLKTINSAQTASSLNTINGGDHRFVCTGSSNTKMALADLRTMGFAFDMASVPTQGRVAIVHPAVEHHLRSDATITAMIQYQPKWEGVVRDGLARDLVFIGHLEGWDLYKSQRLPDVASETINSIAITSAVANTFLCADPSCETLMFGWKQMPEMEYFRNSTHKRDEYSVTARYGTGLYREAAAGVILTKKTL